MACQRIHARTTDPSARPGEDIHVTTQRSRAQRLRANPDAPDLWCGASPLVDLEDPKLRVRAQSLVQTRSSDAEKAQAVYTFVRRLPVRAAAKLRLRTARQVLERGHGDAIDKATLLIALMRLAGLPGRACASPRPRARALRGLPADVSSMPRRSWKCGSAAVDVHRHLHLRHPPNRRGAAAPAPGEARYGYGIHAEGASLWESHRDAYGSARRGRCAARGSERAWRDPRSSRGRCRRCAARAMGRLACWNLATHLARRGAGDHPAEAQPRQRAGRRGRKARRDAAGARTAGERARSCWPASTARRSGPERALRRGRYWAAWTVDTRNLDRALTASTVLSLRHFARVVDWHWQALRANWSSTIRSGRRRFARASARRIPAGDGAGSCRASWAGR